VYHDFDERIGLDDGLPGRLGLGLSNVGLAMNDLALQIGFIDYVEVDDAERPDACRCKIEPSIPTSGMIK
jgi:hypothetical protein